MLEKAWRRLTGYHKAPQKGAIGFSHNKVVLHMFKFTISKTAVLIDFLAIKWKSLDMRSSCCQFIHKGAAKVFLGLDC